MNFAAKTYKCDELAIALITKGILSIISETCTLLKR